VAAGPFSYGGSRRIARVTLEPRVGGRVIEHWHAGIQLTVYRLVQEALTNTMKHAGAGARARVLIGYSASAIDLEIEDDGTASAADGLRPGRAARKA
jgi:signal transduction histidine kinase